MTKAKKLEARVLYENIVKEVQQGKVVIPNNLKDPFLGFSKLQPLERLELIDELSKCDNLPKTVRDFVDIMQFKQALFIDEVPDEIHKEIGSFLKTSSELAPLTRANRGSRR